LFGLSVRGTAVQKQFKLHQPSIWAKLLIPNFIIALGAGAIMPFLNLYLSDKFGLSFESIGLVFGISALSTTIIMLLQPALVNAWGKVGAIIASQTAALPFILIIAYVPALPLVALAMFVREALMNAANPIHTALAMQLLKEEEAAAYMIATNALWRIAWAISSSISGQMQYQLGVQAFDYLFAAMLILYSIAIWLTWLFFWQERESIEAAALAPA
jgi:MFS family permease